MEDDLCPKHNKPLQPEHFCPYQYEVCNDPDFKCRCCEDCELDCLDAI